MKEIRLLGYIILFLDIQKEPKYIDSIKNRSKI